MTSGEFRVGVSAFLNAPPHLSPFFSLDGMSSIFRQLDPPESIMAFTAGPQSLRLVVTRRTVV